eukprot:3721668-Rhodomonas_salina.2
MAGADGAHAATRPWTLWLCSHPSKPLSSPSTRYQTQRAPAAAHAITVADARCLQAQKITNRRVNALEYVVIPRLEVASPPCHCLGSC